MATIALLTDFGYKDNFVGVMKAVIAVIAPKAVVIDLCHEIAVHDIRAGAFCLKTAYAYFPRGAIFVAVVDPGVGSGRSPMLIKTKNYCFIGPDNGVLSLAAGEAGVIDCMRLDKKKFHLASVSQTFHGRDIFAPVAAHIARGVSYQKCGTRVSGYKKITLPPPAKSASGLKAEIISVDRFGNLITNIERRYAAQLKSPLFVLRGRKIRGIKTSYAQARANEPLAMWGSSSFLEIAVNGSSAQKKFKAKIGDKLLIKIPQ